MGLQSIVKMKPCQPKVKRREEEYEHLVIDLKAKGLGIKLLSDKKDQICSIQDRKDGPNYTRHGLG